jgi:heme oxygenase (biliverdin-producing, ferredoxin)
VNSNRVSAHRWNTTRHGTREAPFIAALAAGQLPWKAYADLIAQQFFVHESLEQAAEAMAGDSIAGPFLLPELRRLPLLAADLRFLRGPGWARQITALPATSTYCTRLRDTAFHRPYSFVAHHYARCLDDLALGARLGRAVATWYGLEGVGNVSLMVDEAAVPGLRAHYGRLFDRMPWPPAEEAEFHAETGYAQQLYAGVLDQLARRWR